MRILLCLICFLPLISCDSLSDDIQKHTSFNFNWKFYPGDPEGAMAINFNDSGWQQIDLPFDLTNLEGFPDRNFRGTKYFYQKVWWYRKYCELPEKLNSKTVYLMFETAYKKREVWVNGQFVAGRQGGDSGYYYNITDYIELGKTNLIAVRLDYSEEADSKWYSQHINNRNVWLITPGKTHIMPWGYSISIPDIKPGNVKVKVQIELQNYRDENAVISLINQVRDNRGRKLTESSREVVINLNTETIVTDFLELDNPEFWDIESSYKYRLISILKERNKIIDRYTTYFAIRKSDAEDGLQNVIYFSSTSSEHCQDYFIPEQRSKIGSFVRLHFNE